MNQNSKTFIIAIDGPNSSGKSTLAKEIAKRLNIMYIDTGAMYRALGYYFIVNNISMNAENALKYMTVPKLDFNFKEGKTIVKVNGEDITDKIRTPEISMAASDISKLKPIREYLVELQRNMVNSTSVVMEGRDIASVVFPNADIKIYLTADITIRAERRRLDYLKMGKEDITLEQVISEIEKRDHQDMTRENSPLIKVEDAILLNNSNMTFEETVNETLRIIKEKVNI